MDPARLPQTDTTTPSDLPLGAEAEFLRLVSGCMGDLRRVIAGFVLNGHDVDDVLQETLLKLCENFESYDRDRSFRVWGCAIAANTARNFLKRERLRRGFGLSDEIQQQIAKVRAGTHELAELRNEKFRECLAALSTEQQEMVWRCYGRESQIKDWAASRGLAASTVSGRLRRVRKRLVACVNRKMGAFT
ncbi:MAG: sigma-70 family RNA polymerase sigma factor [Planctomycetota bacterium]